MTFSYLDAVTFDCWGTLVFDKPSEDGRTSYDLRVAALAAGCEIELERADQLLTAAWMVHHDAWVDMRSYGALGMATHILEALGIVDERRARELTEAFEEASIEFGVAVVPGAREALEDVRSRGMRTALVCDTGFTPGRVVRRLLTAHGIAGSLDVMAFSDEVGVPKPHLRMFQTALDGVGVSAERAAHIGDLRRTDIAGARNAGMGTVRFAGVYDDGSELPDADAVIRSYEELPALLPSENGSKAGTS